MKFLIAVCKQMSPAERWMYRRINGLIAIIGFLGLLFGLLRGNAYDYKVGLLVIFYSCFLAVALWEDNFKEKK